MPNQPLNVPVIQKPTPIVLDELLIETVDSNKALYDRMLEKGHYHPDQQRYPAYRFLKQQPTAYGQMQYWWANGFTSQDSYNVVKTYDHQTNAFPTFVRSYRVLRAEYLVNGPSTKGLAFTGVASVAVTNGGANYTEDFAVTFTGGAGSNAAGIAIVDKATGTVLRVELNNVGNGYTSAPVVAFAAGTGTGAAATAVIQPTSCVLTDEEHSKLPEDDPYQSLYDKVTLTWDTLPGATVNSTRLDFDGLPVNIATTKKLISDIHSNETLPGGSPWTRITMKEGDSTLWAYEVVETRVVPGNIIEDTRQDFDGVTVTIKTTLKAISSITPGEDIDGGGNLVTTTLKKLDSDLVALEIVESRAATGNAIPLPTELREAGDPVIITNQLVPLPVTTSDDLVGSDWVRQFGKPFAGSALVGIQVTETRAVPGGTETSYDEREYGDTITVTQRLIPFGSAIYGELIDGSNNWVLYSIKAHPDSTHVAWQLIELRPATGRAGQSTEVREAGDVVAISEQLIPLGNLVSNETIDGSNNWVRSFGRANKNSAIVLWQVVESRPATGNIATAYEDREAADVVTILRNLVPLGSVVAGETIDGSNNWVRSFARDNPDSSLVVWQITESRADSGGQIQWTELQQNGDVISFTRQLYPFSSISTVENVAGGNWTKQYAKPNEGSALVAWFVTETRAVPGHGTTTKERDSDGAEVTILRTLKVVPVTTGDNIASNVWTRITVDPMGDSHEVAWEVNRQRAVNVGHAPTLLSWEVDPETKDAIKVQKTLIDASLISSTPSGIAAVNQETTYTSLNDVVALEVVRTINGGSAPTGYTDFNQAEYTTPRRLYNLVYSGIVDNYGNAFITYNPVVRDAHRVKALFKIVVTFPTSFTPTVASYKSFVTQAINYNGLFLNVREGDVINDSLSITYTTASTNPRWTSVTDGFSFSASTPYSATAYDALRGTYVLVSAKFGPWGRFNADRLEQVYVLIPDES